MDPTKLIQQQYLDPYRQQGGVMTNGIPTFGGYGLNPFANIQNLMPGGMRSVPDARKVPATEGLPRASMMNMARPQQQANPNQAATMLGNKFLAGNAGIGPDGGMGKWGSAAAKGLSNAKTFFGAMKPGSGSTVANAFGKASLGKPGGFMSKVGALPGWSMPVAAAAGWQINKRLGQKAHQKDLARYQEQIKNTPTNMQHTLGPAPTHNRNAGLLGRLFRR